MRLQLQIPTSFPLRHNMGHTKIITNTKVGIMNLDVEGDFLQQMVLNQFQS